MNMIAKTKVTIGCFDKDGATFPIITLNSPDTNKFGFTFGLSKARLIMDNIEAIKQFIEDNDNAEAIEAQRGLLNASKRLVKAIDNNIEGNVLAIELVEMKEAIDKAKKRGKKS